MKRSYRKLRVLHCLEDLVNSQDQGLTRQHVGPRKRGREVTMLMSVDILAVFYHGKCDVPLIVEHFKLGHTTTHLKYFKGYFHPK